MSESRESDLLAQLDELRGTISQREKTIKAIQSALKNLTTINQKAAKALYDFGEQFPEKSLPDASSFNAVKEAIVDPLIPELRREARVHAKVSAALKEAVTALRGDTDVVRLAKAQGLLENTESPLVSTVLPQFREQVQEASHELAFNFGSQLRSVLSERGLTLDGQPPRFAIGRFELELNFQKRMAALRYGKDQVAPKIPLSIDGVIKAYDQAAQHVTGRDEDGARWFEQLYLAWENVRRKRDAREQRVNIIGCYIEIVVLRQGRGFRAEPSKRNFEDYSRAQFGYDLDEFVNRQHLKFSGQRAYIHTATKSQTDNAERSLWLVEGTGPHDGRYVSDILFEVEG